MPPADLLADPLGRIAPALDLGLWARRTFILPGSPLENPDHSHLAEASIGWLWATVENTRRGRQVLGQCELGTPQGIGAWAKARWQQQLLGWFEVVPSFVITIDARYAARASDAEFCALVEHELAHAGQAVDEWGSPRFRKDGSPAWGLKAHCVEEFVSVVRRYGATSPAVQEMAEAVMRGPEIAPASITQACGTCLARAA